MSNDPLAFKRHVLPSGTRLYYQHRPLPFTGCRALIHAGSRHDPEGKLELMHLLEHLVGADMRGIPSKTLTQLQRWLSAQRIEAMLGMTCLDFSCYDVQASNVRFENALQFLRALTLDPTLDSQLDKERDIIRREREEAATPKERQMDNARGRALFGDDPLARSESWAEDADLDKLTIDDCRLAHARWYHPANMSVIIVGGIDEDAALKMAEGLFVPDSRPFVAPPPPPERSFTYVQKRPVRCRTEGKAELVEITVSWYMPMCPAMPVMIAADALEERLLDRIREKQRASYGVDISMESHRDHRICTLSTKVKPAHVQRTKRVIMEEARRMADFDDLERHRDDMRMFYEFLEPSIDDTLDIASGGLVISGKTFSLAEKMAAVETVTTEDVRKAARECLSPERAYVEIVEK